MKTIPTITFNETTSIFIIEALGKTLDKKGY